MHSMTKLSAAMLAAALLLSGCAEGERADVSKNLPATSADSTAKINTCIQSVINTESSVETELLKYTSDHTLHTDVERENLNKEIDQLENIIAERLNDLQSFRPSASKADQLAKAQENIKELQNVLAQTKVDISNDDTSALKVDLANMRSTVRLLGQTEQVLFD